MEFTLTRSGGFAGILPPPMHIATGDVSKEEAAALQKLLEEAKFFGLPARLPPAAGADRFEYTLEVRDGSRHHTVTFGETASPPLVELAQRITAAARGKK